MSSLAAIINEFYSNLSVHSSVSCGHFLTTYIWCTEYQITHQDVSDAFSVRSIENLIFPYVDPPSMDDVVSVLCGTPMVWDGEPRLGTNELLENNYLFS